MIWKESGETEKKLQKKICYKSKKETRHSNAIKADEWRVIL